MFSQSFLKISVLFSTLCLSALLVSSSWECKGAYQPHLGSQAWCQPDLIDRTAVLCTGTSCSYKPLNTGYVPMNNCVWNDKHINGASRQQCVAYDWNTDVTPDHKGAFACTNMGTNHYLCYVDPQKTGFMTCDECK